MDVGLRGAVAVGLGAAVTLAAGVSEGYVGVEAGDDATVGDGLELADCLGLAEALGWQDGLGPAEDLGLADGLWLADGRDDERGQPRGCVDRGGGNSHGDSEAELVPQSDEVGVASRRFPPFIFTFFKELAIALF